MDIILLDDFAERQQRLADQETLADCARTLGGQGGIEQMRLEAQIREQTREKARKELGFKD